jgi:NAD+ synthase (glutamine-hydrolysing)
VRLALCQLNATVGDIAGNAERIAAGLAEARQAGAELVLFPELAITGYPPEDLLLKGQFLADAAEALEGLAEQAQGIIAVVGYPERAEHVFNAAAVLADGAVQATYRKVHLPNYGVFDEHRYFRAGAAGGLLDIGSERIGLTVCEDLWEPGPPASDEAGDGATLLLNISASPYHAGKGAEREQMFAERARANVACVAFCNLVGGQDELVFDGRSCAIDHTGAVIARAAQFREDMLICEVDLDAVAAARVPDGASAPSPSGGPRPISPSLGPATLLASLTPPSAEHPLPKAAGDRLLDTLQMPIEPLEAEVYSALILGLHDYVEKNGFARVVLGLSGGIDSALVACLAADALGAERVSAAIMPSPYSSVATQEDARTLAQTLGIEAHELTIEAAMNAYEETLNESLADGAGRARHGGDHGGAGPVAPAADVTAENLQARIRGNLLMALSNRFGWLVLTTGNKSEMSVGYSTLYGDLAGGLAVIKDVPKTLVYRLAEWRNSPAAGQLELAVADPIPVSVIQRAPSAELRHDQRDEDTLPPYAVLDRIINGYVELDRGREELLAEGLEERYVDQTIRLIDLAEYKRRQAPPGIKVTTRAFGRDRRMPITNRYRG